MTLISMDIAGEWAVENESRWLETTPMSGLDPSSRPEEIHRGVVETIAQVSRVMAEKTRDTGCHPDATPEGCKAWLEACCDQVAAPSHETPEGRTAPRLSNRPAPRAGAIPLLRWAGGSREQAQSPEIVWTRGRDAGPLAFDVVEVGDIQSIIEHGWPADEHDLVEQLAAAGATAAYRAARSRHRTTADIGTISEALLKDAHRYAATPGAQLPDWWRGGVA